MNGPPGVGKSTLARRYVDDHPLTLHLEIDAIRTALGRWQDHDESKLLARTLALAMAKAHLGAARDVIVPQYLGRIELIDTLDELARSLGVGFVEVLVMDAEPAVAERFRERRAELAASGRPHPQMDVADLAVPTVIAEAFTRLREIEAARARTRVITVSAGLERGYRALRDAVNDTAP